jgi:hypothetical protein
MTPQLPMILLVLAVLFFLYASMVGVEAIVLALFRWGPGRRCIRDAAVATASAFMPARFELLQLAFARPIPTLEVLAWGAVVLATETGVYISLARNGRGDQLPGPQSPKLSARVVLTAVAANLASHMVLVAFVFIVTRLVGR